MPKGLEEDKETVPELVPLKSPHLKSQQLKGNTSGKAAISPLQALEDDCEKQNSLQESFQAPTYDHESCSMANHAPQSKQKEIEDTKDKNLMLKNKLNYMMEVHKIQFIKFCPLGLPNKLSRLTLASNYMPEQTKYEITLDPTGIQKNLDNLLQQSNIEKQGHFKYKRFLTFIDNVIKNMSRRSCLDLSLKNSLVKTLRMQLANPLIQKGNEAKSVRDQIK